MELFRAARNRVEALVTKRVVEPVHEVADTLSLQAAQLIRVVTSSVRSFLYYFILASIIFWVIMITSCLVYALFYYLYVPKIAHTRPVYFQFDPKYESPPTAVVEFTNGQNYRFLHPGQNYDIAIDFSFPESEPNLDLGMFMITVELLSSHGKVVHTSSRPSVLKYRSDLLRKINTVVLSVPYMMGMLDESQVTSVSLLEGFKDDQYWVEPIIRARITLSRPLIQVYSSTLRIEAQFTGLRYIMYHWFLTSALIGILSLVFWQYFILIAIYVSYKLRRPTTTEIRGPRHPSRRPGEERGGELPPREATPLQHSMVRRKSTDFKEDVEKMVGGEPAAGARPSEPEPQRERKAEGSGTGSSDSDFFIEEESSPATTSWSSRPKPSRGRRHAPALWEGEEEEEEYEGEAEGYLRASSGSEDYGVESLETSEESEGSEKGAEQSKKRAEATETSDDGFKTPSESLEEVKATPRLEEKHQSGTSKDSELRKRKS